MRRLARWLAVALVFAAPALAAQNLFVNPDLDSSVAPWVLGCGTQMTWTSEDEASCAGSGSLHVTSGPCQGWHGSGAGQCMPVAGLSSFSALGRVRASAGYVVVVVQFFDGADCSGNASSPGTSSLVLATQDWQTVRFEYQAVPSPALSALVGFGAFGGTPLEADVDAGYFGARPLVFRDDFEGNLGGTPPACRWSVVWP